MGGETQRESEDCVGVVCGKPLLHERWTYEIVKEKEARSAGVTGGRPSYS